MQSPMPTIAAEALNGGMMDDGQRPKVTKKDRRRQEKKEERDRWLQEMAQQDDLRMAKCKRVYYQSLLKNLPLQPSCLYPVHVDNRDGVFVPRPPVEDIMVNNDTPASFPEKEELFRVMITRGEGTALTVLADEINLIQKMSYVTDATGRSALETAIIAQKAKYNAVAACVALLAATAASGASPDRQPHAPKPVGFPVRISGLRAGTSLDTVELAFFSHGPLVKTTATGDDFVCFYEELDDAQTAVRKMNGRKWKADTLKVTLVA
ncbi:hypothetical protein DIPPA_05796 [Diplonema papillatum]|nr:hypothetical protein DIPPA_05796 [Diplonema papillatum]